MMLLSLKSAKVYIDLFVAQMIVNFIYVIQLIKQKTVARSAPMDLCTLNEEWTKRYHRLSKKGFKVYYHQSAITPTKEVSDFFDFIYLNNLDKIKELVNLHPNLMYINDSFGNNALHIAALYGHEILVEFFIRM